ncbi:MAG: translation initiation factor IF-3, partial [bacterium]|nr:translation initiation factor IF-3 [bacterium]
NILRFLEEGNKVKVTMVFRGREMVYREKGRDTLRRIAEDLAERAFAEVEPKMEGRQMMMILAPGKKKQS